MKKNTRPWLVTSYLFIVLVPWLDQAKRRALSSVHYRKIADKVVSRYLLFFKHFLMHLTQSQYMYQHKDSFCKLF